MTLVRREEHRYRRRSPPELSKGFGERAREIEIERER
jgi:hypothetical protein